MSKDFDFSVKMLGQFNSSQELGLSDMTARLLLRDLTRTACCCVPRGESQLSKGPADLPTATRHFNCAAMVGSSLHIHCRIASEAPRAVMLQQELAGVKQLTDMKNGRIELAFISIRVVDLFH